MNSQDDHIDLKELQPEPKPITRAELIDKLVAFREDDFDGHDIEEAIRYGRTGYEEMTNEELEQMVVDFMMEEDGQEVRYTITDADTSKPSAEQVCFSIAGLLDGTEWDAETGANIANVLRAAGYKIRDIAEA